MFGNDRKQIRHYYFDVWQRHCHNEPLDALGIQIASVIREHPEYHALLSLHPDAADREYGPDDGTGNPFLHLGMHLAIRDQVTTDRPQGITEAHRRLTHRLGSSHEADHSLMECLGTTLWEAQRSGKAPDEIAYLDCVQRLAQRD